MMSNLNEQLAEPLELLHVLRSIVLKLTAK